MAKTFDVNAPGRHGPRPADGAEAKVTLVVDKPSHKASHAPTANGNGARVAPALPQHLISPEPATDGARRRKIRKAVERALMARNEAIAQSRSRGRDPHTGSRYSLPLLESPKYDRKSQQSTLTIDDLEGVVYEHKPIPKHLYDLSDVIQPMSRRKFAAARDLDIIAPLRRSNLQFNVGTFQVLLRCLVWFRTFSAFALATLWDILVRRDTQQRRAQRLLHTFQQTGGTLVKIGQQLAIRVDVLPYVYCRELAKLLDAVKPFPAEQAIKIIERSLGKPLNQVFQAFDASPIGAASIACVYQGLLKNGTKVAVKVRRPDVGYMFAADLQAMKWFLNILETLTLIRQGVMGNFVTDFENSIMEELDFRKEAMYQELFRKQASKNNWSKRDYSITAPKVFFPYSSADVLVQEFHSGMWAWEIIAAVEQKDQAALARMRELNIEPRVVSKGIALASLLGTMSDAMFHADPHPANIVIKSNNEIVFIDFGACGTINSDKRALYEELFFHQDHKDVHGMVQCALGLLAPLPHIDIHAFEKDLEFAMWEAQCKIWSKHSEWFERTTAVMWLGVFAMTQRYNIPVNLDTVRMFRANMLYDALALRMFNDLRIDEVYAEFAKHRAATQSKKFRRTLAKRRRGLTNTDIATMNDVMHTGERAYFKLKRFINRRGLDFSNLIEKPVLAVLVTVRTAFLGMSLFLVWSSVIAAVGLARGESITLVGAARHVMASNYFQFLLVLLVLINARRVLFRLNDRELTERALN